jgi:multimeric flavodoxin WrbA
MGLRDTNIEVLAVVASPRKSGNSEILINEAVRGIEDSGKAKIQVFKFHGKKIDPCLACRKCREENHCLPYNDDFQEFFDMWLTADALLYGIPVYHMGIPAQLKAAIDRLGNVLFAVNKRKLPRFSKVGGIIAQGSTRFGGQETTIQFMVQHLLLMNCLPLSSDTPDSYIGVPGWARTHEGGKIEDDQAAMYASRNLGKRVGEMARIVKMGIDIFKNDLGSEYHLYRYR